MSSRSRSLAPALAAGAIGALLLQACGSGSGGSQVGSRSDLPPTARAQVLNGGPNDVFRSGSEVLLTGKDSEDADGPLMGWSWQQTGGPPVGLTEVNRTTVSFITPEVDQQTTLTFGLTVEDSGQLTDTTSIAVTVLPARDADKFLSLDVRGASRDTFDHFKVVAALAEGASTGTTPNPLTLSVRAYLVYPPRSAPHAFCDLWSGDFALGMPSSTPGGCRVELLEDLTPDPLPGGGTGIQGEWPANVPEVVRPNGVTRERIQAEWWNPHFTFGVPRLDVPRFNQPFVDAGQRGRMLDQYNAHRARILLSLELTAPLNQADATLILNDLEGDPLITPGPVLVSKPGAQAKVVENDGGGSPTTVIVALEEILGTIDGRESAVTAEVYYRTVDPFFERTTLNAWLAYAGFASDGEGTLRPEAVAGTGEFARALYLNNYDLGFGRDMHMRMDEYGNVYSFVVNYPTLEAGMRKIGPIVTVVMEYSPLNGPADPGEKFVKFFTYVDDGSGDARRVSSMNFDRRGERVTPGNCVACHGGVSPPGLADLDFNPFCGDRLSAICYAWPPTNADGVDIANGNLRATFLPFDLHSFYFADDDPAITQAPLRFSGEPLADRLRRELGDYSRAAQEAQFRKLNQMVHATYCDAAEEPDCATDAARRLVEHWYGGVDLQGSLIGPTFNDVSAPSGWRNGELVPSPQDPFTTVANPDTAEAIYHEVYAQHCRMCHNNITDPSLRFDTYPRFREALLTGAVFQRGIMPAARLTYDRFWIGDGASPTAAERLAAELGIEPVNGRLDPAPSAVVRGHVPTARHGAVRLSGTDSPFARSFLWNVEYEPPAALLGNAGVAGFEPVLVGGIEAPEISFAASQPGTYSAVLTINKGTETATTSTPVTFTVPNFAPQPANIAVVMAEGGSRTISVLDELNLSCAELGCPEIFGDPPASISVNVSAWSSANGDLTLLDADSGTVRIDATQSGPINASIPFMVTDVDLETATAFINVTIEALANPIAVNDTRSMAAQSTLLASPRQISIAVLENDSGDPDALPILINSFTQPANGTVHQVGNNLVYQPNLGFIGTDVFTYNIRDSNSAGARVSANATVSIIVNPTSTFATNARAAFVNQGCIGSGCHGDIAPDWRLYAQVTGPSNIAGQVRVAAPNNARNSLILRYPTSSPPPSAPVHIGGHGLWEEGNPNYNAVLRWIEEGGRNN